MSVTPVGNGVPYLACILAETRSAPYYLATAPTPQALDGLGTRLRERNSVRGQTEDPVPILAVRYEECERSGPVAAGRADRPAQPLLTARPDPVAQPAVAGPARAVGFPLLVTLPEHKGVSYHLVTGL
jgi:putative endonuclease